MLRDSLSRKIVYFAVRTYLALPVWLSGRLTGWLTGKLTYGAACRAAYGEAYRRGGLGGGLQAGLLGSSSLAVACSPVSLQSAHRVFCDRCVGVVGDRGCGACPAEQSGALKAGFARILREPWSYIPAQLRQTSSRHELDFHVHNVIAVQLPQNVVWSQVM